MAQEKYRNVAIPDGEFIGGIQQLRSYIQKTAKNLDLRIEIKDHEGYPKSICSHFESGVQDPSMTCGGAVAEYSANKYTFWRG